MDWFPVMACSCKEGINQIQLIHYVLVLCYQTCLWMLVRHCLQFFFFIFTVPLILYVLRHLGVNSVVLLSLLRVITAFSFLPCQTRSYRLHKYIFCKISNRECHSLNHIELEENKNKIKRKCLQW